VDILDTTWFRLLAGLLVGLCLGSFVTMLSYRVPRRLSILFPPSSCPQCKTTLKALDLVPVLSWIAGRGKCRHCHSPISPRYLIIELITAFLVTASFITFGFKPQVVIAIIGIVSFVTLVTINIERQQDR